MNFSFDSQNAFYVFILLGILYLISGKVKDYTHYFSPQMLERILIGRDQKKINFFLMTLSFIFLIFALARPIVANNPVELPKQSVDMIVAFDISKSMLANDVYPNRLQFAKNKFYTLLENTKEERIGVIGFSSSAFMVAPLSDDMATLQYLVQNLSTEYISTQGSDINKALQSANKLLKDAKQKALVVFSDGTDENDFTQDIAYAKEHNIKVFIYAIATQKGGAIPQKDDVLKDSKGNIVVTKLNSNIKDLALESGGAYLEYSSSSKDIQLFLDAINKQFEKKDEKTTTITDNEEYFYIPLLLAIIFYMIAISGFRRIKK